MLANKLKMVLPKVISTAQSAFIQGRSIVDNVIIAFEVIHHMKCTTRGKFGEVAFKVDISKAYDRVDWGYLQSLLLKMEFAQKWVNWIMLCISSVTYSVVVNDQRVGSIIPGRGLR